MSNNSLSSALSSSAFFLLKVYVQRTLKGNLKINQCTAHISYPGYQRFFLRAAGIFGVS